LSGIIISRNVPRVAALFRNIFHAPEIVEITETDMQKMFRENFKNNAPPTLREFEFFKEKCYEVFEILGHSTKEFKNIVLIGDSGVGRSTLI
jgi:hypothetical protein